MRASPAGSGRLSSSGTITGASRGGSSLDTFGQPASRRAIYDPQRRALVVTAPKANAPAFFPRKGEATRNALQPRAASAAGGGAPSTAITWNTRAAIASFGKPDPFNVDLSGGGLTTAIPIAVPAGPGAPSATYTVSMTYDDADRPVTLSLPATEDLPAETLTYSYNDGTDGGLASLTSTVTALTSTLFQQPTYTSQGLLSGWKSGVAGQRRPRLRWRPARDGQ